jgi:hypothetical protein
MNYIVLMGIGECFKNLDYDIDFAGMRNLINLRGSAQIEALYVFHHEIGHLIGGDSAVYNWIIFG